MNLRFPSACALCATLGCSGGDEQQGLSAVERGRALFEAKSEAAHEAACSTCHPHPASSAERIFPGADLKGVTLRPSYWGGQEKDLLRAVNYCRTFLQGAEPLQSDDAAALDLWAYLGSLEGPADVVPFTVVTTVQDLPAGDAARGVSAYDRACKVCHGSLRNGEGRALDGIPVIPRDPIARHGYLSAEEQRLVFIEKIRHGAFLGYDGVMPPFSLEALPDGDLSDLLSALELDAP